MAFGTGHHGTTLGCLMALDRLLDQGFRAQHVIDVGCGTAVLAMAAAKVWPIEVIASDIDAQAVDVAEANVTANGLTGRIRCIEAAGFDTPDLDPDMRFDLIFANILKGPLVVLAPDLAARAAPGSFAILSGILNEQADEVVGVYEAQGYGLAHRAEFGEWTTLTLQMPS